MTEIFPDITIFSQKEIAERIVDIRADETRHSELKQELYEFKMRESEIAEQLGIRTEKPIRPFPVIEINPDKLSRERHEVTKLIGDISVFGSAGRVARREEDSDEGIGHESNKCFSYEIVDGTLFMAALGKYRRFGWTRDSTSLISGGLICSPTSDFPLISEVAGFETLKQYKRSYWHLVRRDIQELHTALRWKSAVDSLGKIISDKGSLVVYEAENPRYNREAMRASFENDTDEWFVQLGGWSESYNQVSDDRKPSIRVDYKNKVLNRGFSIRVQQDNIIPYIWDRFNNTITEDNYLDYVEKVLDLIADNDAKV